MRVCKYAVLIALAVMMLSFSFTMGGRAEESYYMVLFSYDSPAGRARDAHTFATFVKVDSNSGDSEGEAVSVNSISWLPGTLDIRYLRRPEAGVNMTLEDTLKLAADRNLRVTAWGPYRIKRDLYDRAVARIKQLNSGTIAYKALDVRFRAGSASNCIHAVSDVADAPLLDTGTTYGVSAAEMVRAHFNPWIIENARDDTRVKERLGLDRYSITYRE